MGAIANFKPRGPPVFLPGAIPPTTNELVVPVIPESAVKTPSGAWAGESVDLIVGGGLGAVVAEGVFAVIRVAAGAAKSEKAGVTAGLEARAGSGVGANVGETEGGCCARVAVSGADEEPQAISIVGNVVIKPKTK
jgi:hypothetical protein